MVLLICYKVHYYFSSIFCLVHGLSKVSCLKYRVIYQEIHFFAQFFHSQFDENFCWHSRIRSPKQMLRILPIALAGKS